MINLEQIEADVRSFLANKRSSDTELDKFLTALSQHISPDIYLFGGSIRRVATDTISKEMDLDFAVDNIPSAKSLHDWIHQEKRWIKNLKVNSYGSGYAASFEKTEIDIWDVNKTIAFNNGSPLSEKRWRTALHDNEDDLLNSVFFSSDAVAFSLKKDKLLYLPQWVETIATKNINVINGFHNDMEAIIIRAIRLAIFDGFRLSDEIKIAIRVHVASDYFHPNNIVERYEYKYNTKISANEIVSLTELICI